MCTSSLQGRNGALQLSSIIHRQNSNTLNNPLLKTFFVLAILFSSLFAASGDNSLAYKTTVAFLLGWRPSLSKGTLHAEARSLKFEGLITENRQTRLLAQDILTI